MKAIAHHTLVQKVYAAMSGDHPPLDELHTYVSDRGLHYDDSLNQILKWYGNEKYVTIAEYACTNTRIFSTWIDTMHAQTKGKEMKTPYGALQERLREGDAIGNLNQLDLWISDEEKPYYVLAAHTDKQLVLRHGRGYESLSYLTAVGLMGKLQPRCLSENALCHITGMRRLPYQHKWTPIGMVFGGMVSVVVAFGVALHPSAPSVTYGGFFAVMSCVALSTAAGRLLDSHNQKKIENHPALRLPMDAQHTLQQIYEIQKALE